MKKFLIGVALLAVATPLAAADNFNVIQAGGATRTKAAKDLGGDVLADRVVIVNTSNTDISPATEASVDGIETLLGTSNTNTAAATTALQLLDNTVSGNELQVDVLTLPALAAGTNNIGDVDVLSLPAFIGSGAASVIQSGACATLEGCIRSMRDSLYAMETDTNPVAITNDGTNVLRVRDNASATPVRIVSAAASTNLTEIADSGGCRIISISGAVARTSPVYLKLYNAADGSVTVGTTTPYITIPLPAGGTNPTSFQFDVNQTFASAACSLAMTTAVADNSTAALTAADVVGLTVLWAVQ